MVPVIDGVNENMLSLNGMESNHLQKIVDNVLNFIHKILAFYPLNPISPLDIYDEVYKIFKVRFSNRQGRKRRCYCLTVILHSFIKVGT